MADRTARNNTNHHLFDLTEPAARMDVFLRSESPRVQQILLHQELRKEIDRNSAGRVRYVDSELYLRNNNLNDVNNSVVINTELRQDDNSKHTPHEPRLVGYNLHSGRTPHKDTPDALGSHHDKNTRTSETISELLARDSGETDRTLEATRLLEGKLDDPTNVKGTTSELVNKDCQVCLIKEIRQDLMSLNSIVQERNEQISKLKSKCLRSYFERQMME